MHVPDQRSTSIRLAAMWLGLALLLAGCGGQQQASRAAASTPLAATPAPGPTAAAPGSTTDQPAQVAFDVETFMAGLEVPWDLAFAPDGRIFLTERGGRVRVIERNQLLPEPALELPDVGAGEGGLLGLALDPAFAENQYVYLYYTSQQTGDNRVVRYTADGNRLQAPQVLFEGLPAAGIHNGGRIAFGPDGKLYVTAGDAANGDLSQDPRSAAGKIHRINPDGSLPADNPFPGSSIYSYGHRNPQGLAWHPETGQLYATEHGSSAHDEVNLIRPGANYGWPVIRGQQSQSGMQQPLVESGDSTWAPSGAAFISSERFPGWRGSLLFTGLRSQTLWRLELPQGGGQPRVTPLLQGYGRLRQVVEGPDGLIYVLTNNRDGRGSGGEDLILRLVPR